MRIRVMFEVECSADAAWEAAHTPAVASELYRPLLRMTPIVGSLPERFESGDTVDVSIRFFGVIPAGIQRIAIQDVVRARPSRSGALPPGARTMRDAGTPLTGPLSLLKSWNHEITVWPPHTHTAQSGTAVWHDELTIHGFFAPFFALTLWPMWWWRRRKLRRLARTWS